MKRPIGVKIFFQLKTGLHFKGLFSLIMVYGWCALVAAEEAVVTLRTTITGNQEQPKVLYIVPWKAPTKGDILYQSLRSQLNLDGIFTHMEKSELRRKLRFVEASKQQSDAKE